MRLREAFYAWLHSVMHYTKAKEIFVDGGLSEPQLKEFLRTNHHKLHLLQMCIWMEVNEDERNQMGPQAKDLPYPMKAIHHAKGASLISEQAMRLDFLCERTPFLDSLEASATFCSLPRFYR